MFNKHINIGKKGKILIASLITIIIIVIIVRPKKQDLNSPENKDLPNVSTYKELTLGKSTRNEVVNNIGVPDKEYVEGDETHLEYNSLNPNLNDQFLIVNDSLAFIKKIIVIQDKIKVQDLKIKYGNPEYILYGPGSSIGLKLFIYPSKGIAYIGFENKGYLTEIWYFEPTDIDNFKTRYADNYSETPEETQ